ncbi:MAG: extracellular solute-binding protein [Bacillota bacterium]|nr:extracellular solute-binding protein [Bacillota bacterium]
MKKRRPVLLIVILLSLSLTAACANTPTTATQKPTTTTSGTATTAPTTTQGLLTPVGTYPIVNQPVTLNIVIQSIAYIQDFNTNEFTLYLEDLTGIDLNFEVIPEESAKEKMNLMLTSNQYQDIFWMLAPDREKFGVEENILIDLTDLIEANMPNLSAHLQENPNFINNIKSSDGKIYALPRYNEVYHYTMPCKMWVNTMQLEKLDMAVPTTTDEFYNTLKKYKETNPDGIPLAGYGSTYADPTIFLANPFTYYPYGTGRQWGIRLHENKVETAVTTDEYKEMLRYLNKLYEEELLYEGTFTMDANQMKALVTSEGEPVLFTSVHATVAFIDPATQQELYSHYYPIAPLKGPNGSQYVSNYTTSISPRCFITDKCAYPEVATRFADYFYTMEGYLTCNYGMEGTGWKKANPGSIGLNGESATFEILEEIANSVGADAQNIAWPNCGLDWLPDNLRNGQAADENVDIFSAVGLEKMLYQATKELYKPFYQEEYQTLYPLSFLTSESSDISTISVEVEKTIRQAKIDFITGAKDIDADWGAYLTALEGIGMNKLLEVYQAAYDRQYNN